MQSKYGEFELFQPQTVMEKRPGQLLKPERVDLQIVGFQMHTSLHHSSLPG
jgi:hypothetical protein